jgi:hypothetical protein
VHFGPQQLNSFVVPEADYNLAHLSRVEARRVLWARIVVSRLAEHPDLLANAEAAAKWASGLYERNYVRCVEDLAFLWRALEEFGGISLRTVRLLGPGGDLRSRISFGERVASARLLTGIGSVPVSWYVARLVASFTGTRLAREDEVSGIDLADRLGIWLWCAERYAEPPESFDEVSEMRLVETQMRVLRGPSGARSSMHPGTRDGQFSALLIDEGE